MTRKHEHEITISAPIDAVWKAITDAEELTRWFAEEARVNAVIGGTIWRSLGGAEVSEGLIMAWEPGRRLQLALLPFKGSRLEYDGTQPMIEEYTMESHNGKTVLRLVHSGIPDSPDWDGYYDGTDFGWKSFFRTLRHYLEHNAGKPRSAVKIVGMLPGSLDEGWARLTGASGFNFETTDEDSYTVRMNSGRMISGHVVFAKGPIGLELTIREFDDTLLTHAMAGAAGKNYVYSLLSLYGMSTERVEATRVEWEAWLKGILGLNS